MTSCYIVLLTLNLTTPGSLQHIVSVTPPSPVRDQSCIHGAALGLVVMNHKVSSSVVTLIEGWGDIFSCGVHSYDVYSGVSGGSEINEQLGDLLVLTKWKTCYELNVHQHIYSAIVIKMARKEEYIARGKTLSQIYEEATPWGHLSSTCGKRRSKKQLPLLKYFSRHKVSGANGLFILSVHYK